MAKLLDDEDFAEIREVINDVTETFGQKTVVYKLSESYALKRFGRDNYTSPKTDKNLLTLVVWKDESSEIELEELGKYDFSDGFILFGWDYLVSENLIIDDGNGNLRPIFEPMKDNIIIDGETLEIMGVWTGGQLKDTDSVVKIFFKRNLQNG